MTPLIQSSKLLLILWNDIKWNLQQSFITQYAIHNILCAKSVQKWRMSNTNVKSIVIVPNLCFVLQVCSNVALWCSVETDKSDIRSPRSPEGTRGNLMPAPVFLFTNQLLFPLPYLSLPTSFFFPLHHFACWRISFCRPPSLPPLFLILSRSRRGELIPCRLKESMKMIFLTLLHSSSFSITFFLEDISERPQELIPCRRLREGAGGIS